MGFCLAFQETPTKELGHCGAEARGPERGSPAPSSGSPCLGRCMNSESSTDEEGILLGRRVLKKLKRAHCKSRKLFADDIRYCFK